jgi:hypothetical protein
MSKRACVLQNFPFIPSDLKNHIIFIGRIEVKEICGTDIGYPFITN